MVPTQPTAESEWLLTANDPRRQYPRAVKRMKRAVVRHLLPQAKSAQERDVQFEVGGHAEVFSTDRDHGEELSYGTGTTAPSSTTLLRAPGAERQSRFVCTYPFGQLFPEAAGVWGRPRIMGDPRVGDNVWIGGGP